jgi:hypothetical protein
MRQANINVMPGAMRFEMPPETRSAKSNQVRRESELIPADRRGVRVGNRLRTYR